jgi:hypothetical protein
MLKIVLIILTYIKIIKKRHNFFSLKIVGYHIVLVHIPRDAWMRKEESNKINDSLDEKDMILNKWYSLENGEIVFRKYGRFFLCVYGMRNVEDMRTMIWKKA